MKTQLQKPARGKGRYSPEYQQEALELWRKRTNQTGSGPRTFVP